MSHTGGSHLISNRDGSRLTRTSARSPPNKVGRQGLSPGKQRVSNGKDIDCCSAPPISAGIGLLSPCRHRPHKASSQVALGVVRVEQTMASLVQKTASRDTPPATRGTGPPWPRRGVPPGRCLPGRFVFNETVGGRAPGTAFLPHRLPSVSAARAAQIHRHVGSSVCDIARSDTFRTSASRPTAGPLELHASTEGSLLGVGTELLQ